MKQPDHTSRREFLRKTSIFGLGVAFAPGIVADVLADSKLNPAQKENTMAQTNATQASPSTADKRAVRPLGDKTAIRPFQINFPDADLTELRRRINATRWPDRETVADDSQGVQLATVQALASYWGTDYDWRKGEA